MTHTTDSPIQDFSHCHEGIVKKLELLGELPALLAPVERARHIAANVPRLRARLDTICVALRKRSPICDRYIGATIAAYLLTCEEMRDMGLWPCSTAEDDAVVRAVIAENEKDVVLTTDGKFATVAERIGEVVWPTIDRSARESNDDNRCVAVIRK